MANDLISNSAPVADQNDMSNLDEFFSETGVSKEEFFKSIKEFYFGLKSQTNVSPDTIKDILKLYFLADLLKKYDEETANFIYDMLDRYMQLRISKNGKGRDEFFNAIRSNTNVNLEPKKTLRQRLFGI